MTEKIEIFTDGACSGNPGPCGIGIVMKYGARIRHFSESLGQGTNNIAELTAILRALRMVKNPEIPVVVYTDSQYALGVLSLGWKAKQNRVLVEDIRREMQRFREVRFVKVEGHADIHLNNMADELARDSIRKERLL
jgi:ribonuclease HI